MGSFDDTAERIFAGSLDNNILIYDMRRRDADPDLMEGHTDSVTGLDVSKDGSFMVSNAMDNTIRIWDIRPFSAQPNLEKNLLRVRWSANDQLITAGSADQNVCIW